MVSLLTVLLPCTGWPVSCFADNPAPDGKQVATEATVTTKPVLRVAGGQHPLYRVSYSYNFPGRTQVYIGGVGTVGSKGSLEYLQSAETVEFFDVPGGNALYVIKLEHPITFMGSSTPAIPDEAKFPQESRRGHWHGAGPFAEKAFAVLEQHFPSGYRTFEKDTSVCYLTTYTETQETPDGTRTQVSVLISYAAKSNPEDVIFTIAFTTRERRSHTDWRDVTSDVARNSAESFVGGLLNELQR